MFAYTDEPERRFSPGSVLTTADRSRAFTVVSSRRFKSRWIVLFEGVADRNASEALSGTELYVEPDPETEEQDDAWYLEDLIGLEVRMAPGNALGLPADKLVGTVKDVIDATAQQLLEIELAPTGKAGDHGENGTDEEAGPVTGLVPFVEQLVPEVDPDAGYIGIDPPKGLLPGLD